MAKTQKTAQDLTFEAFGRAYKKPRYLFSRNNLKIMYGTDKPKEILEARAKKIRDYGFDPEVDKFSKEEFEIMLFFDYLEALLGSFRLRSQAACVGSPYSDMSGKPKVMEPSAKKWDVRPLIRMLSNFCCSIEICGIEVQALRVKQLPSCLETWREKLSDQMDYDYRFYKDWKDHCVGDAVASMMKIM